MTHGEPPSTHAPSEARSPRPTDSASADAHADEAKAMATWLASDEARATWEHTATRLVDELLELPLRALIDEAALLDAFDAASSQAGVEQVIRPLSELALSALEAVLGADPHRLDEYLPADAQDRLLALAARPDLVPPDAIRAVFEHGALEAAMHDVLTEAIRAFSERANPFAEQGIAMAALRRVLPLGVGRVAETLRGEVERGLEPELKRFLKGASRAGLRTMASFVSNQGDPRFVALRRELVTLLLSKRVTDLAQASPPDVRRELGAIALDTWAHVVARPDQRALRRAMLQAVVARYGATPTREVLASVGVRLLDPAPFVRAAWPVVRAAASRPAFAAWLERTLRAR